MLITLFFKHATNKVAIMIVYMDDIVITGDDIVEIVDLKNYLAREFKVKDLGQLKYFLGIEISCGSKKICFISTKRKWNAQMSILQPHLLSKIII
jgi:hypothetical protein